MSDFQKPIQPIITGRPDAAGTPAQRKPQTAPGTSFGELLHKRIEEASSRQITFSKHARERTAQRGIELSDTDIGRLSDAIGKAGDKGVTDTLVFMNNTAFIVNVPSKVVITVVDGSESENNIFTNIDGAVIL